MRIGLERVCPAYRRPRERRGRSYGGAAHPLGKDGRCRQVGWQLVMDVSPCDGCGSSALVETVIHDGDSWIHQLVCRDCRHVLEAASYLTHEPAETHRDTPATR